MPDHLGDVPVRFYELSVSDSRNSRGRFFDHIFNSVRRLCGFGYLIVRI